MTAAVALTPGWLCLVVAIRDLLRVIGLTASPRAESNREDPAEASDLHSDEKSSVT